MSEVEWVGEGRVLPISRFTCDYRLYAIDDVKRFLRNLNKEQPDDKIVVLLHIIEAYIEWPAITDNRKDEWEYDERQMKGLDWPQDEIDARKARYDAGTQKMLAKLKSHDELVAENIRRLDNVKAS